VSNLMLLKEASGLTLSAVVVVAGLVPAGGLDAEQVAHEEIHSSPVGVRRFAHAMTAARYDQQIEIFVRLDERIDDLHRRGGIHVPVQLRDGQQQFALQVVGLRDV